MTIEIKTNQELLKYEEYSLCLYSYEYSKRVVVNLTEKYNEPTLSAYFKGAKIPYFSNRTKYSNGQVYTSSGDSFPQGSIHPRTREYVEQLLKDNPRRQFTFTPNVTITSPGLFSNQIIQANLTFYIPTISISYKKNKKKRKKNNNKKKQSNNP